MMQAPKVGRSSAKSAKRPVVSGELCNVAETDTSFITTTDRVIQVPAAVIHLDPDWLTADWS